VFGVLNVIEINTEEPFDQTLEDPSLQQILQEAVDKVDFDPEEEQEKLREFLAVANNKIPTENIVPQGLWISMST